MWKPEHRRAADRRGLRYPSDLIDAEWALVEPMIPPAKHGGRKRSVDVREVLNGIFYVLSTGCQWNAVPTDLPPTSVEVAPAVPGVEEDVDPTWPPEPEAGVVLRSEVSPRPLG